MNPGSRDQKCALAETLNGAILDPSVGRSKQIDNMNNSNKNSFFSFQKRSLSHHQLYILSLSKTSSINESK